MALCSDLPQLVVAAVVAEVEGGIPLLLVPPVLPARPVVAAVEEGEEEEVVVRRRGRPRAGSAPLQAAGPPEMHYFQSDSFPLMARVNFLQLE